MAIVKASFITTVFLAFLSTPVWSDEFTFGTENANSFPWIFSEGGGANTIMIEMVAANLGHTIKIKKMPWKRCLFSMNDNKIDGCYAASFKEARMELGVYPMANDTPDSSKRLHIGSYSLYVLKDSTLDWNGENFINLTGLIGAPRGFSIISKLKERGATVDEVTKLPSLFNMLILGRLSGVAALTPQGDRLLKQSSTLGEAIRKVEPLLARKPYYLMFSHKRSKETPELISDFYDEIERVRNSQAYEDAYNLIVAK